MSDEQVARLEERMRGLEAAYSRILQQLDRQADQLDGLHEQLARLQLWMVGTALSLVVAAGMLLLEVLLRK